MRGRKDIEGDHAGYEKLTLEVLLDIRDLLKPKPKVGRPVGSKNTGKKKVKKVGTAK